MQRLAALLSGLIFGLGLNVSGMIDPRNVLAFLDLAGDWDFRLALVMAGGLAVTLPGYRLLFAKRAAPLFDAQFHLPVKKRLDGRLIAGSVLFGLGWGLAGLCPGPALAALGHGAVEAVIFVLAMVAGLFLAKRVETFPTPRKGGVDALQKPLKPL